MRATRFTHASVHADDLEESVRFYTEVFGMRRVPSPDFPDLEVEWLEFGDVQLHVFLRDVPAPDFHHVGLDVDDFETAYRVACERELFDGEGSVPKVRELNDGALQMYLRDPAGNLVEVNWPDVSTIDRSVVTTIRPISDERPQSEEALRASLYPAPQGA
jgi:catechol 2,3-dioxygenase-like lactoylglutathione lyase family enzyme